MTTNPQPTPETDAEYYRRVLHRVIDAGVAIIGKVETDCTTARTDPKPDQKANSQAAEAYAHLSRGIRRCILLAKKVAQPDAPAKPAAAAKPAAPARRPHHDKLKHVFVDLKDAVDAAEPDIDKAEILHAEVLERLESLDRDDDIDKYPVEQLVARLCRDMGIPVPPRKLKPAPNPFDNPYAKLTDDELNDQIIADLHLPRPPRRT